MNDISMNYPYINLKLIHLIRYKLIFIGINEYELQTNK